jgi:hypothetical protein
MDCVEAVNFATGIGRTAWNADVTRHHAVCVNQTDVADVCLQAVTMSFKKIVLKSTTMMSLNER